MEILFIILKVIGFLGGSILFLISVNAVIVSKCGYNPKYKVLSIILLLLSVAMIVTSSIFVSIDYDNNYKLFYESIENYVNKEGYTIYINGTEVDLSHIHIESYPKECIFIEDETKEIHISVTK